MTTKASRHTTARMTTRGGRVRSGTAVGRPRCREPDEPEPDAAAEAARSAGTWRGRAPPATRRVPDWLEEGRRGVIPASCLTRAQETAHPTGRVAHASVMAPLPGAHTGLP